MHRNATYAFVDGLRTLLTQGQRLTVRGQEVIEVRPYVLQMKVPTERTYVLPHRHNSIFATIAETIWVIAGRNDIAYLSHYLPRAAMFSDDGVTWRGGYGPRIRNWAGIDQVSEVVRLLRSDPLSRRAVVSLFDPSVDFTDSKDIPCNNWLQFLIRDGSLHLHATIRSNDAMWGFSGINTFEWSVLHEMMALWTGSSVGDFTYFVGSFHLYQRHYSRARRIINSFNGRTLYDVGILPLPFATPFKELDSVLEHWFRVEAAVRSGADAASDIRSFPDPFLRGCLGMLELYNRYLNGTDEQELQSLISELPLSDFRVAAIDYFAHKLDAPSLYHLGGGEDAFFNSYRPEQNQDSQTFRSVFSLLSILHVKKTRVYKDAWKKRGEIIGVLANIARKFDRLEVAMAADTIDVLADESRADTLADLATYAAKYITFLADNYPTMTLEFITRYRHNATIHEYQGNEGFDAVGVVLSARYEGDDQVKGFETLAQCFAGIQATYHELEDLLLHGERNAATLHKCDLAADLVNMTIQSLLVLAHNDPSLYDAFARTVSSL